MHRETWGIGHAPWLQVLLPHPFLSAPPLSPAPCLQVAKETVREESGHIVIRQKDKALKEKDVVMSEIQQRLVTKEAECREQSATIRAQQAEIQQLRDQLAVPQRVS